MKILCVRCYVNFPREQFGNCCILGIKFLKRVIFQKLNEKPDLSEDTGNEVNAALELLEKLTKPDKLDVEGLSSVFYSILTLTITIIYWIQQSY